MPVLDSSAGTCGADVPGDPGVGTDASTCGQEALDGISEGELIERIKSSIIDGDAEETMRHIRLALDEDVDIETLIDGSLISSMDSVGKVFKNGEFYVPDVLMSSRAIEAALYVLDDAGAFEKFQKQHSKEGGTVVIGTVAGDMHDIGKNIAGLLLRCEGYKVVDLGIDVVPSVFVDAVREYRPKVLGLSALLTTTMGEMRHVLEALVEAGVRDEVKVYVSGAPVTQEFADIIGADHYCPDARDTVDYLDSVMAGCQDGD